MYSPGAMARPRPSSDGRTDRSIVLVGTMGVGKTTVGRRLAARLGLPFVDADQEIETAAGMTISEIFERFGEPHFRDGERRVIARLIAGEPQVIATGGGAFINPDNRLMVCREQNTRRFAGPAFLLNQMLVWGFTGQVISALLDVAGWAKPWNTDDVRELDDAMALVGHEDSYGEAQQ